MHLCTPSSPSRPLQSYRSGYTKQAIQDVLPLPSPSRDHQTLPHPKHACTEPMRETSAHSRPPPNCRFTWRRKKGVLQTAGRSAGESISLGSVRTHLEDARRQFICVASPAVEHYIKLRRTTFLNCSALHTFAENMYTSIHLHDHCSFVDGSTNRTALAQCGRHVTPDSPV
jgi:hypothetical protein